MHKKCWKTIFILIVTIAILPLNIVLATSYEKLNIEKAKEIALSNNHTRIASAQSLQIAEQQYKQALSFSWPEVNLNAIARRLEENPTYEIDGLSFDVPTPFGSIPVETGDLEFDLFDRDSGAISLDLSYPLYTGGLISAKQELAKINIDVANTEVRRTELNIIHDVEKYFTAVLLTRDLADVIDDSNITLQIARDLAKAFIDNGSLSVNKRDYLKAEIAVALSESIYAQAVANHKSAIEALKFSMGLEYGDTVGIDEEIFLPKKLSISNIDELVQQANRFNPDLTKLNLAIVAGDSLIKEAKSKSRPKVLFESSLTHLESKDLGLINDSNSDSWSIGVSMQIPLFQGFRSKHVVSEAKLRKSQYETKKITANKGVATAIKQKIIELDKSNTVIISTEKAVMYAENYADLTMRSYQQGLVNIDELIESQIYRSSILSSNLKAKHDLNYHSSHLNYIVGKEINY